MNSSTNLLSLNLSCEQAVEKMVDRLTAHGLQVIRTFDLQSAWASHTDCACPQHGQEGCDCQLVILLVYDEPGNRLTILAHGVDNKTNFALVDYPEDVSEEGLRIKILQAIAMHGPSISGSVPEKE